jgi:hypothetical protein
MLCSGCSDGNTRRHSCALRSCADAMQAWLYGCDRSPAMKIARRKLQQLLQLRDKGML